MAEIRAYEPKACLAVRIAAAIVTMKSTDAKIVTIATSPEYEL